MADLARHAEAALIRLAVDDEAGADARGQADVDQIVDTAGGPERFLSERPEVRVVVERDRDPQTGLHLGGRADSVPAGEDPIGLEVAACLVDRRRARPMPTPSSRSGATPALCSAS